MSDLDGLIARSRKPGTFVERRRFTLSRERAIEKLREFSLRHPRQYVLELVQAAHFAGATYIAVDVNPHSALVAYVGGRRFLTEELEQVFDYLFADRGARQQRHLVQLAIGLNALLQRKPKVLRIESGDGTLEGTVRMDLDAKGKGNLGVPADPLGGTYIFADFGTNWIARFQGVKWTEEQGLVEERCLYTPAPILLNGRAPFGYHGNREIRLHGLRNQVHFDEGGRRGALGLSEEGRNPGVRVVVGGVWVTTLEIPELGEITRQGQILQPFGVICDDGLRKTADQSDVVQDRRFTEMLHAVQPHATRLLQAATRRAYTPPELPVLIAEDAAGREPLPDFVPVVGPAPKMDLAQLEALPPESPVFWIARQARDQLAAGADPCRFPFRVLILSEGQAETLRETLPGLPLSQLSTPEDTEFIRRVIERGQHEVDEVAVDLGGAPLPGTLTIRLHRGGPMPFWSEPDETPILVVYKGTSQWCGSAPIRLPGVSATIEVDHLFDAFSGDLAEACAAVLAREVWRLIPDPLPPEAAATYAPLAASLLSRCAQPQFVERDDGSVQLDAVLPADWGAGRLATLRSLALARAADGGPLSFDDLMALQGTDRAVTLADDGAALEPLERILGYGHLRWPEMDDQPYAAIGRIAGTWGEVADQAWGLAALQQVVWLGPGLRPPVEDGRWTRIDSPCPALGMAVRGYGDPHDWRPGLEMLYRKLREIDREDDWRALCGAGRGLPRVRAMGRLALFQLARALSRTDEILLPPSDGGDAIELELLRADPSFRVAARYGVALAEERTVLLSLDELRALQGDGVTEADGSADIKLPLRFDDAPSVWDSLADPDDPGWLVRQEVQGLGLEGWLGLRLPFDGTSGVFLQSSSARLAFSEMDRRLPCHGLLRVEAGRQGDLSEPQKDLLHLAGLQLYQRLGRLLDHGSPDQKEAARLYGTTFVSALWREDASPGSTVRELARRIQVHGGRGARWGTLDQWFSAPPTTRPELPAAMRAAAPAVRVDSRPFEERLRLIFQDIADVSVDWFFKANGDPYRIRYRGARSVLVLLNEGDVFVQSAAANAGRPQELLLLELTRRLARHLGAAADLLELQSVLLAQRMRG